MKKLCLLFLLSVMLISYSKAQSVKFSPAMPEAGKPLSFAYESKGGKLEMLANVSCVAQTFVNKKQKVVKIDLTKEGSVYKGTFTPVDSTAIAVLVFSADGTKDENPNGYYTLFYENGKPTANAYYWEATYYNGMGAALAGIKSDKAKAIAAYDKGFAIDPEMKDKNIIAYLNLQYGLDKVKGAQMINEQMMLLNGSANPKEDDMIKVANLYTVLKKKPSADSVYNLVKTKYPAGTYAYNQAANGIYNEKDPAKAEEKLNLLIKDFKLDVNKKADFDKIENFYAQVASGYGLAKNNAKFETYANLIKNKTTLASIYNSYAWAGFEKKENLEFAAKISKTSLELLEAAKSDTRPAYYASQEDYLKGLEGSYASYADTYAALLDLMGKKEEALKFQEEAVTKNNFTNPEMNARYVNFLAKNGQHDKVVTFAERFIKDGQGTEQMKLDLKSAYKGAQSFDAYYAVLEKVANDKEKAKWTKEMINIPAPTFALLNLKGEKVDLAKLKGKVVVVDYWATWCGPCIASFPGMQKAVDKYKTDPNVVFLFVNTWQTEENREKVVKDWVAANPNYTFNVLLDTKNVKDPSRFDVIDQYKVTGIPTKFIIDGNGNIRFKKIGGSSNIDGTVRELDMMIAMAKDAKSTSK
ncbi:MAG: TlpA family protein disulfide reductase [Pedobacter sp.]|nr:MAG: TlpA family protein disulfide reductase [Pedobacter sp.]